MLAALSKTKLEFSLVDHIYKTTLSTLEACATYTTAMIEIESPQAASPLDFTSAAAHKVAELIREEANEELKLRVYVQGGGCSGFQYGFTFDEEQLEDDTSVDTDGVRLLVDPMSFQYLIGAKIDYKDDLDGARFIINNPNATTTCGCGSSFAA